jgi:hypothetical protein
VCEHTAHYLVHLRSKSEITLQKLLPLSTFSPLFLLVFYRSPSMQSQHAWWFWGFNPLKLSGNCMYHVLQYSITLQFVFMCFVRFSLQTAIISLNSVNRLILVTVKRGVFFAVRTEFSNVTEANFDFRVLMSDVCHTLCDDILSANDMRPLSVMFTFIRYPNLNMNSARSLSVRTQFAARSKLPSATATNFISLLFSFRMRTQRS